MRTLNLVIGIAVTAATMWCALAPDSAAQSVYTEHTLQLDDRAHRPKATIQDVAWLAGHWRGEGLGGVVDEGWTRPLGSTMAGTFMLSHADTVAIYEMMALVEEDSSVTLWVKHFNPDFTGWEEKQDKVTFPLVRVDPDALYFSGLTFKRVDDDSIDVFLAITGRGGEAREEKIAYRRHP